MRHLRAILTFVALSLPLTAHAADDAASAEQFASATATCLKALGAVGPSDVLASVEADGWKLRQTTPIGGIFRQHGSPIELKVETVFSSRICTVFGNRDGNVPLPELAQLVAVNLETVRQTSVRRDETRSDFTLVAEEKYRVVITRQQAGTSFNTQITTIAI